MSKFVLASSSPRRAEILKGLGIDFEIMPSDVEEKFTGNEPGKIVSELALIKCKDVASKLGEDKVIIAADTIVYKDGEILGKPVSKSDAYDMLTKLSGSSHKVLTGICIINNGTNKIYHDYEETTVYFKYLSEDEILNYINTGEPTDKAGSYGIQGLGGLFVEKIHGCYFNVVGLPIHKLYILLGKMGVNLLVKEV